MSTARGPNSCGTVRPNVPASANAPEVLLGNSRIDDRGRLDLIHTVHRCESSSFRTIARAPPARTPTARHSIRKALLSAGFFERGPAG